MTVRADHATAVRADRAAPGTYNLAPPRMLDNGSWEVEAVISTPGVNPYPDLGTVEYVTPEALSSEDYLTALRGLPLIDDAALHWPGVTPEQIERARIGTILDARWDAEQQATIGRIVVDVPRGISAIADGRANGVSLHYTPDTEPAETAPDGTPITHRQTSRSRLNHLLLTPTPNDSSARIRADEASMTPDEIKAMIDEAIGAKIADMVARMDACDKRMDAIAPAQTVEGEPVVEPPTVVPPRADSANEWRQVLTVAAARNVTIPDAAPLVDAQRAVVAACLPQRADSQDPAVLAALIDALSVSQPASVIDDVWTRLAAGGSVRADAASSVAHLVTVGA